MAKISFKSGESLRYEEVQIDDTGWVVATDSTQEKWFPPHRVEKVEFEEWER